MFGVKKYVLESGNPMVWIISTVNTPNFWSSDFGEFSLFYEKCIDDSVFSFQDENFKWDPITDHIIEYTNFKFEY